MRAARDYGQIRVGGQAARSMLFTNNSPLGGREVNWLVTVLRPEGLAYWVFVAPEQDFNSCQRTFSKIVYSINFYGQ